MQKITRKWTNQIQRSDSAQVEYGWFTMSSEHRESVVIKRIAWLQPVSELAFTATPSRKIFYL